MFELTSNYTVDGPILEFDFVQYTPQSLGFVTDENRRSKFDMLRQGSGNIFEG